MEGKEAERTAAAALREGLHCRPLLRLQGQMEGGGRHSTWTGQRSSPEAAKAREGEEEGAGEKEREERERRRPWGRGKERSVVDEWRWVQRSRRGAMG